MTSPYEPVTVEGDNILDSLRSSAAYMDEKARDRFVVTAEALHGAIAEIEQLRRCLVTMTNSAKINGAVAKQRGEEIKRLQS